MKSKPTNTRFVASMTNEEVEKEFELISKKESKLSSMVRAMVKVKYYYFKSKEK